jgi:LemA protein
MNKTIWVLLIIVAIVVLVGGYFWSFYNNLVSLDQGVQGQWAQVENQFQRRFDLIPNLVSSVQGAMTQEKTIFSGLADARSRYAGAQTTNEKAAAATQVEGAFSRLLAIMENYPQLKSIDTVQNLMVQLEGTENRVATERGRYNEVVKTYNTKITQLPGNFIAPMFGFSAKTYFEAAEGSGVAPKVEL